MNQKAKEENDLLIQAYDMARQGATRGMVAKSLRRRLGDDQQVDDLVNRAFSALAGKRRLTGLLQMAIGSIVIGVAAACLFAGFGLIRKTLIALILAGFIILISGAHDLWHR